MRIEKLTGKQKGKRREQERNTRKLEKKESMIVREGETGD